ncbi:LexA family transcriptional regulator [Paracnuella aquatica]|uniref:LexA family transcriptional regulator n=1 Tax=Paracnuella aquatica TaxID=2268757 RepID=UPI000DEF0EB5|nr:LexA family transcriptional regulator [Paracnuella aquatica]RPD45165.1 LexA family transcriptional regulator [Paracnuella aquatica]
MATAHYNLREIRQLYNLTQEEFALALGLTREMINKMEGGKCRQSRATQLRVKAFLDERKSENFSQDVEFMGVPAATPRGSSLPYFEMRREQKQEKQPLMVPLVGIKAQAGYVKGFEQTDYLETLEKYSLPPGVNPSGAMWSYFEVDGDSMEPTFYAGDVLLASMLPHEDWHDVKNFSVYIILTTEQLLVKRVYRKSDDMWVLLSDNEELYPQVLLPVHAIRQVWTFRRHIRSRAPQPKEFKITA